MLDPNATVARTVLDHSECAPVFQRHRIDYCCKGNATISAASKDRGVDVAELLADLERAIAERRGGDSADPREMSTPSLVAYVVSKHHDYLRKTLPFVRALAAKVSRVHGDHNPRLVDLHTTVGELVDALEPHLDDEEKVLFPALIAMGPQGVISTELGKMREEHLAVGALLERMRDATEDYRLPDWACNSYRTLFSELEKLETDVLRHVHLENHVLMPRFEAS